MSDAFRRLLWGPANAILRDWPEMDWVETPTAHLLKFNVPGLGKDNIKVQLDDGNLLSIRGEGGAKEEPKEAIWHLKERGRGDFVRQVVLPDGVKVDNIKAQVDNGVLTVVMPKETSHKAKSKNISISSKL